MFVGHGTPMNAIEDNKFSGQWRRVGKLLPASGGCCFRFRALVYQGEPGYRTRQNRKWFMICTAFRTSCTRWSIRRRVRPRFAGLAKQLLAAQVDHTWGLDHGSWSVLRRLFPMADVPIFQISVDRKATAMEHFEMGRKLRELRNQGRADSRQRKRGA